ncbi:hypothetical protein ACFX2K_004439 [Malus domestica]
MISKSNNRPVPHVMGGGFLAPLDDGGSLGLSTTHNCLCNTINNHNSKSQEIVNNSTTFEGIQTCFGNRSREKCAEDLDYLCTIDFNICL